MGPRCGWTVLHPKAARYVKSLKVDVAEFARDPHIVGITRELELPARVLGSALYLIITRRAFGSAPVNSAC